MTEAGPSQAWAASGVSRAPGTCSRLDRTEGSSSRSPRCSGGGCPRAGTEPTTAGGNQARLTPVQ